MKPVIENCRNTFRSHENLQSSIEKNGMRGFKSNLCQFMFRIFIMSKKISINKQNIAVSAASGEA